MSQHVDVQTHYSEVITTLLHEHSALVGQTTAIFRLSLHSYLNYTPVFEFCMIVALLC